MLKLIIRLSWEAETFLLFISSKHWTQQEREVLV